MQTYDNLGLDHFPHYVIQLKKFFTAIFFSFSFFFGFLSFFM